MKMLLMMLLSFGLGAASGCEEDDNGPVYSDADRARCAHIDRRVELGEHVYSLCLCCPWPASEAELPPATSEGLSTFGCRINDTLTVINYDPRVLKDQTAYAKLAYELDGSPSPYRLLIAGRSTFQEIDPRGAGIVLRILPNGSVPNLGSQSNLRFRIRNFGTSIDGEYRIDTTRMRIHISRWDNRIVAGTIDAWFIDPEDSSRQIHLTEGRFDVTVRP